MAKKRHRSMMGSQAEHHTSRLGESYYDGNDPRRKLEREDGAMLHEDHNAIANMPQEVIMRMYPKSYGYMPEDLDDTIRGIDKQIKGDDSKRRQHSKPHKF